MKRIKNLLAGATVAAALAIVPTAAQAVVVNVTTNIAVPNNIDGVYINVVTGATSTTEIAGYDFNPYNNGAGLTFYTNQNDGSGTVVIAAIGTSSVARDLPVGTVIGSGLVYQGFQVTGPQFQTAGTHILGFRFFNESTNAINYGYARIQTAAGSGTSLGFPATVIGYSYENTGAAITVVGNATPAVPEPASWAMMILGAGMVGGALRRRSSVKARVAFA